MSVCENGYFCDSASEMSGMACECVELVEMHVSYNQWLRVESFANTVTHRQYINVS